jgi:hypothetical protein
MVVQLLFRVPAHSVERKVVVVEQAVNVSRVLPNSLAHGGGGRYSDKRDH